MFSRVSAALQNYPQKFQEIYLTSKTFSEQRGFNLDEVFDQTVKFHDPKYTLDQIRRHLESHQFQAFSIAMSNSDTSYDVWLTYAESGQGKSTLVNAICGSKVAVEGEDFNSTTEGVKLYTAERHRTMLLDTQGLFDTRAIQNIDIVSQIIDTVQKKLKQNANIRAIILIWSPNFSRKFRLQEILLTLRDALGEGAIHSVVFLVNKVSSHWDEGYEKLYQQFLNLIRNMGLRNSVFLVDLKNMSQGDVDTLKALTQNVRPFREEDFEIHRIMIYYQKFLDVQRVDEEKKRERMEIEEQKANEMEEKFKKQQEQIETEHAESQKKLEELHKEELAKQKEESDRILQELREEQEKIQREKEEEKKSKDDGINISEIVNAGLPVIFSAISRLMGSGNQATPSPNVHTHPSVTNPPIIPSNGPQMRGPGREIGNPFVPGRVDDPFGSGRIDNPFGSRGTDNPFGSGRVDTPYGLGLDNPFGQGGMNNPFGQGGMNNPFGQGGMNNRFGQRGMNNPFGSRRADIPNSRQPGMDGFLERRGVNNRGCFGPPGGP